MAAAARLLLCLIAVLGIWATGPARAQDGLPGGVRPAAAAACGAPVAFDFPLPGAAGGRAAPRGGGIVGAVQGVAEEIAAAGGGSAGRAVRVTVRPRLERLPDGGARVTLDVAAASYVMPADVPAAEADAARRRLAQLLAGLRSWSRTLPPGEAAALGRGGAIAMEVREPFAPVQPAGAGGPAGPAGIALRVCGDEAAPADGKRRYHVARLVLDDGPWRARNERAQSDVRLARGDRDRAEEGVRRAVAHLESKQADARVARDQLLESRRARDAADEALAAFVPDPARTTPEYRALVHILETDGPALDAVFAEIAAAHAAGRPVPDEKLDAYDRLRARIDKAEERLARLDEELGFARDRHALEERAIEATAVAWQRNTRYLAVIDVVSHARSDQLVAFEKLEGAEAALAGAEKEASALAADAPLVRAVGFYAPTLRWAAEIWDPSEAIAFLDARIAALRGQYETAGRKQMELRYAHLVAQETASRRLRDLEVGILELAAAQGAIELGFMARDVIEKFVETGPVGALGEATKKFAEAAIFGAPTFKEYEIPNDPRTPVHLTPDLDHARDDLAKVVKKRAVSSFVTGQTSSAMVAAYIAARDLRIVREAFRDPATTPAQLTEAFESFLKAEKSLAGARGKFILKDFWAPIAEKGVKGGVADLWKQARDAEKPHRATKIAQSLARDVAKQGLKQLAAAALEGRPLEAYLEAEIDAQLATQAFLAASAAWWDVRDRLQARIEDRRELVRQYDPRNHMRIAPDEKFDEGAGVVVEITDRKPEKRRFAVAVGGREMRADAGSRPTFRGEAKDLAADGTGGVELKVVILE